MSAGLVETGRVGFVVPTPAELGWGTQIRE